MANFAEIRLTEDGKQPKGVKLLLKRYSGQAKYTVLTSLIMQFTLLLYLSYEVFSKKIVPSCEAAADYEEGDEQGFVFTCKILDEDTGEF